MQVLQDVLYFFAEVSLLCIHLVPRWMWWNQRWLFCQQGLSASHSTGLFLLSINMRYDSSWNKPCILPQLPTKIVFFVFYFFLGALGKTIYLLGCQRDIFSSSVMFHGFVLLFFFLHNFSDCLMRLLFSLILS